MLLRCHQKAGQSLATRVPESSFEENTLDAASGDEIKRLFFFLTEYPLLAIPLELKAVYVY